MRAVECAKQISLQRPLHVIRDYQIKLAVAVVIYPCGAGGELIRPPHSSGLCCIRKCAVAVVVKQVALTERSDEQIVEAVVVVISDSNAEPEHGDGESSFASGVCERPIV